MAVVRHDVRCQDALVADRPRHHLVHEEVVAPDEVLAEPTRHQETERPEVEIVAHRPAPGVGDDEPLDAVRIAACEFQSDRAAPVRHEQSHVLKVESVEQGSEPVRVAPGVVVFPPAAARRETETDVVGSDAAKLRTKPLDKVPELEGPGRIAVHEHDRLAFALVDEVHPLPARRGEEPALERVHLVRYPIRTGARRNLIHEYLSPCPWPGDASTRVERVQLREATQPAALMLVAHFGTRKARMRQCQAGRTG